VKGKGFMCWLRFLTSFDSWATKKGKTVILKIRYVRPIW